MQTRQRYVKVVLANIGVFLILFSQCAVLSHEARCNEDMVQPAICCYECRVGIVFHGKVHLTAFFRQPAKRDERA